MSPLPLALPENQLAIRRACLLLCRLQAWAPLNEFTLPSGRRCDIMALTPDGSLICIEIKSGPRDYLNDRKWPEYRGWCDQLFVAVDNRFPMDLLPPEIGRIVVLADETLAGGLAEATILQDAPEHRLNAARRRILTTRFAREAAQRLTSLEDPAITASFRAAGRSL